MKSTGTCPKCNSREVLRIPWSDALGAGNIILTGMTILSAVKLTRFLCTRCGYSEQWVESQADIDKVRSKYGG